ncbi:MAG: aldehyde dehydrogenase family protein [Fodinibius sp.]|nr:aldehyde dehydrogenase family protein [Fodinibius sp.]
MQKALEEVKDAGGEVIYGGEKLEDSKFGDGHYVRPAIAIAENEYDIVQEETFAPILYLIKYSDLNNAIAKHNGVKQGLSSSMFTLNMRGGRNLSECPRMRTAASPILM